MTLTKSQLLELANTNNKLDSSYTVSSPKTFHYPLIDFDTKESHYSTLVSLHMSDRANGKEHTTFIATIGIDKYYVWCGDKYMTGELHEDDTKDRVEASVEKVPESIRDNMREAFNMSYDVFELNSGCNNIRYMSNLKKSIATGTSSGEVVCKHIKNMFHYLNQTDDLLVEVIDRLDKDHKKGLSIQRVSSGNMIEDTISDYFGKGESLFFHGEGGTGKTYEIKEYCESNNISLIKVDGHQQMEAIDLYGYVDIAEDGEKCWGDGPISQAARQASKGIKTVLFLDEFALIPYRETASMKAPFEPYKGFYFIETGRKTRGDDNILVKETLEVPVENLQIIAAANFGDGYAAEDIDKALKQRFLMRHYQTSEMKVKKVLTRLCEDKGFSESNVNKLINFRKSLTELKERGELPITASLRHLSRKILELAKDESNIIEVVFDQVEQFVDINEDGMPIQEQCELYEEIVQSIFA